MGNQIVNGVSEVNFGGMEMPVLFVYEDSGRYRVNVADLDKETGVFMIKDTLEEIAEDIKANTRMTFIPRDKYDPRNLVGAWV